MFQCWKLWILSWILKLWILSRRLLSRIVAISITIIYLSPMFASLYFYSFPNPPPPLPHFHCSNIGNWACVEIAILNTIFTVQLTLAYSNLASTRFRIHSVFKNFHSGEPIQNVADSYADPPGMNHTQAALEPLWGRADTRHVSFWISCFYNGIVYSFFFWNYKSLLCWLNLLVDKY